MNIQVDVDFDTVECFACGIVFGFSSKLMQHRKENGNTVWCPNGHRVSLKAEDK